MAWDVNFSINVKNKKVWRGSGYQHAHEYMYGRVLGYTLVWKLKGLANILDIYWSFMSVGIIFQHF